MFVIRSLRRRPEPRPGAVWEVLTDRRQNNEVIINLTEGMAVICCWD